MPAVRAASRARRRAAVAGALFALVLTGCDRQLAPTRGILLLSLDTLRADHLGCYGYARDTSPFLDQLAARGVLFEQLVSQFPSTMTSHMSILTGLYPAEHGVFSPRGQLAATIPTLPELLQRAGYRTAGFTEAGQMRGKHGFARGFTVFDDRAEERFDDVERTLERGLGFLRSLGRDERYFLFLHTYAIHTPYDPPPPYDGRYWSGEAPDVFPPIGRNFLRLNSHKLTLDPAAVEYFAALYDGSIRYVDDRLRRFFAEIEALGLAGDLTVVVTSDHGEEFLEHGQLAHAQVYRESLHVPLIVLHPGIPAPRRVPSLVETVDLAPTLLALAGVEPPRMSGRSLLPWLAGGEAAPRGHAFSEVGSPAGAHRSLHLEGGPGLHQLVHSRLYRDADRDRSVAFDVGPAQLELRLRSYRGEPRRVEIRIAGELHDSLVLAGDQEARVVVPAAHGAASRRVRIDSDSCTPSDRRRPYLDCLAFHLTAPEELHRLELFALDEDPLAQRDRAAERSDEVRRMLRLLDGLRWRPRATPGELQLEAESVRQLEALGYL